MSTDPDVGPPRWVWWLLIGLTALVVAGVGAFMVVGTVHTETTTNQIRGLLQGQKESAARNDCRTAYQADRDKVIELADALERQSNIDFAGYLLGDPSVTVNVLADNKTKLEAANMAVLALPNLDAMVDMGYSLNGLKHPPCPMVR